MDELQAYSTMPEAGREDIPAGIPLRRALRHVQDALAFFPYLQYLDAEDRATVVTALRTAALLLMTAAMELDSPRTEGDAA